MPNLQEYCADCGDYINYGDSIIYCDYCNKNICTDCLPDDFYNIEYTKYVKYQKEYNEEYISLEEFIEQGPDILQDYSRGATDDVCNNCQNVLNICTDKYIETLKNLKDQNNKLKVMLLLTTNLKTDILKSIYKYLH